MAVKKKKMVYFLHIFGGLNLLYIHDLVENVFQTYELSVLETKPGKAVSIIETDMNVSRSIVLMEGYQTHTHICV